MVHDSCVIRDRVWECQHYHHSLLYFPSTNINNMSFPCFPSKSENHDMDSSVHLVCHEEPSVVVVLPFVWREVHLEFLSLLLPSLFLPSDQVSRKSCTHGIPESESLSTVSVEEVAEKERLKKIEVSTSRVTSPSLALHLTLRLSFQRTLDDTWEARKRSFRWEKGNDRKQRTELDSLIR